MMTANLNYYRKTLGIDWPGIGDAANLLEGSCDSRLEVLFGLAFLFRYRLKDTPHYDDSVEIRDGMAWLSEPFGTCPDDNGSSSAWVKPQVTSGGRVFDFGIYTDEDNGMNWKNARLAWLIEIDGYGCHRGKRESDERKSLGSEIRVLRFPEERFKSIHQMALAALYATIWNCGCEYYGKDPDCEYCSDLRLRIIS